MTFDGEGKKMFTFRAKEVGQKQIYLLAKMHSRATKLSSFHLFINKSLKQLTLLEKFKKLIFELNYSQGNNLF